MAPAALALAVLGAGCGVVTPPARAPKRGSSDAVHVRLASPIRATLVATDGDGAAVSRCASPCDRDVATEGRTFVVHADGHASTPPFTIPRAERGVVVRYDPDSTGQTLGIGLLVVPGATAMGIGGTLALLDASGRDDFSGTAIPGAILAAVGSQLVIGGVIIAVLARSDVTLEEATKHAATGIPFDL